METENKVLDVYDIIKDYFGEELTDMQHTSSEYNILIRFPNVRITNEFGKYIDITELYVKIPVNSNGTLREQFRMLRTEYTGSEWAHNYVHSHCDFNKEDYCVFSRCCLGSGPLVNTTRRLFEECNLDIWGLFCFELSKYVTIESVEGIPYRRLENIGKGNSNNVSLRFVDYHQSFFTRGFSDRTWIRFYKDFIKHNEFKVSYTDGYYYLGEPIVQFWLKLSNWFIKWINEESKINPFIAENKEYIIDHTTSEYLIEGSKAYSKNNIRNLGDFEDYQGKDLFVFKGEMKKLHIYDNPLSNNYVKLLVFDIVNVLLVKSLLIINYNYGNKEQNTNDKGNVYL